MDETDPPEPSVLALHRIPNGFVVLLAVALMLQGPAGAFNALWDYTNGLVRSLFGGEELFWEVFFQTAPLALASAAIAFAVRSHWIAFKDITSVIAVSCIILTATWFGGELRSFQAKSRMEQQVDAQVMHVSAIGQAKPDAKTKQVISISEALAMLTDFRGSATDSQHHRWSDDIPRVAAIPREGQDAMGLAAKAINQLLGYFVVYGVRLFLAAVLVGCYIGWSWQPYIQAIGSRFERRDKQARPLGVEP